ncbi:glutathione S-transferase [Dokdonella immobilis]|uniref:glutathione transferase n=2 Tax=Dokdonella immobilis TaxID=578942 RepID=A0A1I4Z6L7_9GAMM|nr:glutathione S-transferase [Dokdonella immobilis]
MTWCRSWQTSGHKALSMITVHHLNNSRSQRVLWLLEELQLDYEVVRYERDEKTMLAPPALRRIHPLGKSPVISDGDITVAESGAIIEYLVDGPGHGQLKPKQGTAEQRRYTYWLHYAEGSAMPPLLMSLVFARIPKQPMPFFVRPIARGIADKVLTHFINPQLKVHQDFLESELRDRDWFAGRHFTAADIQMSFPVEALAARGGLKKGKGRLGAWLERIHDRPAYQRALLRGGPYALMS